MPILPVSFELLAVAGQRSRTGRSQINWLADIVGQHFAKDARHLQPRGILGRRRALAFDRLGQSFGSADAISHPAREFLEHVAEMLEIAADEKLRLPRRDIERLFLR